MAPSRKATRRASQPMLSQVWTWLTNSGSTKSRKTANVASYRSGKGGSRSKASKKYASRSRVKAGVRQGTKGGATVCLCARAASQNGTEQPEIRCVCARTAPTQASRKAKAAVYRAGIKLRSGTLRTHGYSSGGTGAQRHKALERATNAVGPTVVIRKLTAVSTLTKNTNPVHSARFKKDAQWVRSHFGTTKHPKK